MPRYYRLGVVTVYEFLGERFLVPLRMGFAARLAEKRLRSDKRKALGDARRHVHRGARQKAVDAYESLIRLDPEDARLRLELGDLLRRWGRVDEAICQYTKLADQYRVEGFEARAVALLKQVLKLDGRHYPAYASLSELYLDMGRDGEAMHVLQVAIEGLSVEGKAIEALELVRRVSRIDPEETEARIKVAGLLQQEGFDRDAVGEFEAVSQQLEQAGDREAQAAVCRKILEIAPSHSEALVSLSTICLQKGQVAEAESFARQACETSPEDPASLEVLVAVCDHRGLAREAAEVAEQLGNLYRSRGDEDRARELSQRWPAEGLNGGVGDERSVPTPELESREDEGGDELPEIGDFDFREPEVIVGEEGDDATLQGSQSGSVPPMGLALASQDVSSGHQFVPAPAAKGAAPPCELALEDSLAVPEVREEPEAPQQVDDAPALPPAPEETLAGPEWLELEAPQDEEVPSGEEGLDDLVENFKKGVDQALAPEDLETRYELGIAYREMGLFEDAIGEFAMCRELENRQVDCLYMMALCSLDLGKQSDAAGYLQQALELPIADAVRRNELLRELGDIYESLGDSERAESTHVLVTEVGLSPESHPEPASQEAKTGRQENSDTGFAEPSAGPDSAGVPKRVNRVSFV